MTNTTTPAIAEATTPTACGAQPHEGQTRIEIYTDGSCIGNPGHGGYGVVILRKDTSEAVIKARELLGHDLMTTNIRMEMTAAAVALESLGRVTAEPITLFCDARLLSDTMNRDMAKWKARGWKKSDGKEPANRDLWERIERAAEGRNVTWAWVRGHSGPNITNAPTSWPMPPYARPRRSSWGDKRAAMPSAKGSPVGESLSGNLRSVAAHHCTRTFAAARRASSVRGRRSLP